MNDGVPEQCLALRFPHLEEGEVGVPNGFRDGARDSHHKGDELYGVVREKAGKVEPELMVGLGFLRMALV
eukprot:89998-Rhodomonas_salina.1